MNKLYFVKEIQFIQIIILVAIVIVSVKCKKESPVAGSGGTGIAANPSSNRPLLANAGLDFSVGLFSNEMTLIGKANDRMGNTLRSTWRKIAGPACTIISPQSLITRVTNLVEGEYKFELLVSDNFGVADRDTVEVKAVSTGSYANLANFLNLSWSCPMGCTIEIDEFFSHIPPDRPFRVLIKPENQTAWYEAFSISQYSLVNSIYFYEIYNARLIVYTESDARGTADVKILF